MPTTKSSILVVLCCTATSIANAKNIDYTPDLTSSAYWDSHHIAQMRVTAIHNENDGESVTYQVETRFSDDAIEAIRTVPRSYLWFGRHVDTPHPTSVDDRFVIYYDRDRLSAMAVTGIEIVDTLGKISRLRENPGNVAAYLDAVLDADPTVARYSLRHLLSGTASLAASADYTRKLLQIRDDESRDSSDRILTGRLANRLAGLDETPDAEYSWLQTLLAGSRSKAWQTLTPVVERLLEFAGKRPETASFLARLASDTAVAQSIRIAAYGAFTEPGLMHFDAPDAESTRIYQACLRMLRDPEQVMRSAGAVLVFNITMSMNPVDRPAYLRQSRTALAEALSSESNELAQFHLGHFLKLLSN